MNASGLPVVAGIASTVIFVGSTLPMLIKAYRSRDMASYSLGNLTLATTGNVVHAVYVYSLPFCPLWLLHGFNTGCTLFMLVWFLRHEAFARTGAEQAITGPRPPLALVRLGVPGKAGYGRGS